MLVDMENVRIITPNLQYKCLRCGDCCTSKWTVLLYPGEVAALDELYRGSAVWYRERRGKRMRVMKHAGSTCVWLAPDKRCTIHTHQGWVGKALTCKLYPRMFLQTPDGIEVIYSWDCPGVRAGTPGPAEPAALAELRELVAQVDKMHDITPPFPCGATQLDWETYKQLRNVLREELARDRYRLQDSLKVLGGYMVRVSRGTKIAALPAEQRPELLALVQGGGNALFRRYLIALLLLMPEEGPDELSPRLALDKFLRLDRMAGLGRDWEFRPAGWRFPIDRLETTAERLDEAAERAIRGYLGELVRRHTLARFGDLELGYRFLVLLYRVLLVHAAAAALQRGGARIDSAAAEAAIRLTERYYALHLNLQVRGWLGGAAMAFARKIIQSPIFFRSIW